MTPSVQADFWRDRAVLVTGHTGFKGAWLTLWLQALGARVTGFADRVPTTPSLYELARAGDAISDLRGDIRDHVAVRDAVGAAEPEIVIHMAAQAFVRRSFAEPRETYETNVMGTVNVLEAVRATPSVRVVVNVTSDKCYDNFDGRPPRPFVEDDPMGGHDPYSSSKGCAELVSDAYLRSFFAPDADWPRLASARAGNVIGGGDWGEERLIPDIMRGALTGAPIPVRNPEAVRPWQHVLNPLSGYLCLAQAVHADPAMQGGWNFGPDAGDAQPVRVLADRLTGLWPGELHWKIDPGPHPHEAHHLALDSSKARTRLGWAPAWDLEEALAGIVEWYGALAAGDDMRDMTLAQIEAFSATRAARGPSGS
ncbi:MAG TPA: CDP-glucose 4,6-dehydratase [Solirubrobacteraceae bacterium]|nr:CDP-glucose 4,6-dehydratase [Solirubrobacteraceae bacterium]